jgi:hypothetical protein
VNMWERSVREKASAFGVGLESSLPREGRAHGGGRKVEIESKEAGSSRDVDEPVASSPLRLEGGSWGLCPLLNAERRYG